MNQPFNEEILSAYLDGELDDAQRAAVESALEQDEHLQEQLGSLQDLHETWQALPSLVAPEDTVQRLKSRIESALPPTSQPANPPQTTLRETGRSNKKQSNKKQWLSLAITATAASALTALLMFIGTERPAVTLIHEMESTADMATAANQEMASMTESSEQFGDSMQAGGEVQPGMGGMGGAIGGGGIGGLDARSVQDSAFADKGGSAGGGFGATLRRTAPLNGSTNNAPKQEELDSIDPQKAISRDTQGSQIVRVQCTREQLTQLGDLLAKNNLTLVEYTIREELAEESNAVVEDAEGERPTPNPDKPSLQLLNNYERQLSSVDALNAKRKQVTVIPHQVVEGTQQQVDQLLEDLDSTADVKVAVTTSFYQQNKPAQRLRVASQSDASKLNGNDPKDKPAQKNATPNPATAEAADADNGQAKESAEAPARTKLIILLDVR